MSHVPRILIVSPIPSHPADQGNSARIQALGRELLAAGMIIDFFYYGMEGLSEKQRADMEACWSNFHFMRSLPVGDPTHADCWGVDDWCPISLCNAVRSLHERVHFDAVIVNYVWMSRVLVGLEYTFRIIDTHDIFGDRHIVAIREGLEPRWFFTRIADEDIGFSRADLLIGIQEHESEIIRRRVPIKTITIGHRLPPYFLINFEQWRALASFGYFGSSNPWNVRSVQALDQAIAATADIDWLLAGSLLRRDLTLRSGPYLLGVVGKPEEFYSVIDCVVNPMLGGTGLKIKTIEALAFGKPVIGTIDAFQGLNAVHDAQKLKTIAQCVEVMRAYQSDEALRDELRLASRCLFIEYSMKVDQEMRHLIKSISERKFIKAA